MSTLIAIKYAILVLVLVLTLFFIRGFTKNLRRRADSRPGIFLKSFSLALDKMAPISILLFCLSIFLDDLRSSYPQFFSLAPLSFTSITTLILLGFFFQKFKKNALSLFFTKSRKGQTSYPITRVDTLSKLISIGFYFILALFLLDAFGYSANTLLTIGGVGAAFIGFAIKDFAANFFGGIVIYLTQPFGVGDQIIIKQKEVKGEVQEIGWYLTRVIDEEKQPLHIPNSLFSNSIVITPSRRSHRLIKEVLYIPHSYFGITYSLIEEINSLLKTFDKIDPNLRHEAFFSGCEPTSCKIEIIAYTEVASLQEYHSIKQHLLKATFDIIEKQGAKLSEPTLKVSFDSPINFDK